MKFRPLHDRVLVRRVTAEEKTAGGIIIPDTAKEKPQEGEVIAVGPGARDDDVAALLTEGHLHRVGEDVDTSENAFARVAPEFHVLGSHFKFLECLEWDC